MIVGRAAIGLTMVACAASAGCRTPGISPKLAAQVPRSATDAAAEPTAVGARSDRSFTIMFATFIPANHLVAPCVHPQSYGTLVPPTRLAFSGDDRGFDVDAPSFRAKQVVTLIPDEAEDADGLLEGSKQNLGGITESFNACRALADGRIDESDRSPAPGREPIRRRTTAVNTEGMIIDDPVRLGPHRVFVRLRTAVMRGPRNGLIAWSPSIDWDIRITIDTSGPEPTYLVTGRWDGYPAAELYINRQPVLLLAPGDGPGSTLDLLKLLPGYGDLCFIRTGVLAGGPPRRLSNQNNPSTTDPQGIDGAEGHYGLWTYNSNGTNGQFIEKFTPGP